MTIKMNDSMIDIFSLCIS